MTEIQEGSKVARAEDGGMYSTPRECPCGESHLSRDLYWRHRLDAENVARAEIRARKAEQALREIEDFCTAHLPFASEKSEVIARRVGDRARAALSSEDATRPTGDKEKAAPKDGLS